MIILKNFELYCPLHLKERMINVAKRYHQVKKQFKVWWKSKVVSFLCCDCYRKATRPKKERTWERVNQATVSEGFVSASIEPWIEAPNPTRTREISLDDLERELMEDHDLTTRTSGVSIGIREDLDHVNHEEP
jgi:hypothetical protein